MLIACLRTDLHLENDNENIPLIATVRKRQTPLFVYAARTGAFANIMPTAE